MVLLNLRAVPRSPDVVFKLVSVDEDQWTQECDEYDATEVEHTGKGIESEDTDTKNEGGAEGNKVVDYSQTVAKQVSEDGDEAKDAQTHIQKAEDLWVLAESTRQQDACKKDSVDRGWVAREDRPFFFLSLDVFLVDWSGSRLFFVLRLVGIVFAEDRFLADGLEVVVNQMEKDKDYTGLHIG